MLYLNESFRKIQLSDESERSFGFFVKKDEYQVRRRSVWWNKIKS